MAVKVSSWTHVRKEGSDRNELICLPLKFFSGLELMATGLKKQTNWRLPPCHFSLLWMFRRYHLFIYEFSKSKSSYKIWVGTLLQIEVIVLMSLRFNYTRCDFKNPQKKKNIRLPAECSWRLRADSSASRIVKFTKHASATFLAYPTDYNIIHGSPIVSKFCESELLQELVCRAEATHRKILAFYKKRYCESSLEEKRKAISISVP